MTYTGFEVNENGVCIGVSYWTVDFDEVYHEHDRVCLSWDEIEAILAARKGAQ